MVITLPSIDSEVPYSGRVGQFVVDTEFAVTSIGSLQPRDPTDPGRGWGRKSLRHMAYLKTKGIRRQRLSSHTFRPVEVDLAKSEVVSLSCAPQLGVLYGGIGMGQRRKGFTKPLYYVRSWIAGSSTSKE